MGNIPSQVAKAMAEKLYSNIQKRIRDNRQNLIEEIKQSSNYKSIKAVKELIEREAKEHKQRISALYAEIDEYGKELEAGFKNNPIYRVKLESRYDTDAYMINVTETNNLSVEAIKAEIVLGDYKRTNADEPMDTFIKELEETIFNNLIK